MCTLQDAYTNIKQKALDVEEGKIQEYNVYCIYPLVEQTLDIVSYACAEYGNTVATIKQAPGGTCINIRRL